jgi:hypothetical protein
MTATTTTLDPRPESPERTNGHSSRAGLPGIVLPPTRKNGAKADQSKASKPPKKAAGKNGANGHAELIVYRRLDQLAIHPLAKDMPMLPADAPEMVSLVASIELHGLERQPLVIDGRDRIMDGRHRCAAAKRAGLETVPCIVRAEEEAGSIIIDSLAARRHLTKGALAYVSWPLLDEAAKERAPRHGSSASTRRISRLNRLMGNRGRSFARNWASPPTSPTRPRRSTPSSTRVKSTPSRRRKPTLGKPRSSPTARISSRSSSVATSAWGRSFRRSPASTAPPKPT